MHGLFQDLRLAIRHLVGRPWWSGSIVAVLAVGLAGNAAMFSGFDTWVLRPLPFERPQELVHLWGSPALAPDQLFSLSASDYDELRRRQSAFASLTAFRQTVFNLDDELEPASRLGARIEYTLFPMLGVRPALGRSFDATEDRPGQPAAVALVSDRLWRERYGASPDVLGRTLRLDGRVHEIVGVMPPGFEFPEWEHVWVPLGLDPDAEPRDARGLSVIGRLAPGHTVETARAQVEAAGAELARLHPETREGWSFRAEPLRSRWLPDVVELALSVSLGAAVLVLLVICANVASLFLAAAEPRTRELALRTALGGSRARVVRPLLFEGFVLALLGAGVGLVLAVLWQRAMLQRVPVDPPYLFPLRLDLRVGLFALVLAAVAGLLCTLPPLWRGGANPSHELRGVRSSASRRSSRLRGGLVIAELAFSTALVAGALLMVKSFLRLQEHEGGYRTEDLYLAELALTAPGLETDAARGAFVRRLHDELGRSPLVEAAGVATAGPASSCDGTRRYEAEGRPATPGSGFEGVPACPIAFAGDYFGALGLPLVAGLGFESEELERGGDAVVVSEGLAQHLWGGPDVLGRRMRQVGDQNRWLRVVGVVPDVRQPEDMVADHGAPQIQLYRPYPEMPSRGVTLAVSSPASASELATVVRSSIRAAGSPVALAEVLTIEQALDRRAWVTRFFSEQLAVYAAAALLVAALGIYGLVADAAARRRQEIAVRLALGARRREVVGLVAGWGLYRAALGIAAGLGLGLWVSRLAGGMLVGVEAWDPFIHLIVAVVLAATAVLASFLPARRAARSEPATLLREG